jgi:hypothetical protein
VRLKDFTFLTLGENMVQSSKNDQPIRPAKERKPKKKTQKELLIERAQLHVDHVGLKFGHKHYVFIAKLKQGELWALDYLSLESKGHVTPLFELGLPNKPFKKGAPTKSKPQHIEDSLELVKTQWTGLPFFLDLRHLAVKDAPPVPEDISQVFSNARVKQLAVVPVTSPLWPIVCQNAIRGVIQTDGRGVMLRLEPVFFDNAEMVQARLKSFLSLLGVDKEQVDILIDLSYQSQKSNVKALDQTYLRMLPDPEQWRTVTVAAGCFPDSISNNPLEKWIPYERADWLGYASPGGPGLKTKPRIPSYGDYGIRSYGRPGDGGRGPLPNLRYTSSDAIWTRRGNAEDGAMRSICQSLISQTFFSKADFSEGDKLIALKAASRETTNGSAPQWIEWCTNHHLELTSSQIQNLPLP